MSDFAHFTDEQLDYHLRRARLKVREQELAVEVAQLLAEAWLDEVATLIEEVAARKKQKELQKDIQKENKGV